MLSTGNKEFNAFLNVGIDGITTIYGKAGTGKTCLCIMTAAENCKANKVVFINCEDNFPIDRFKQIAGNEAEKLLDNLILINVKSFKDQHKKILEIKSLCKNVPLVIIDGLSHYYRMFIKVDKILAINMLNVQMSKLAEIVKDGKSVLITNHVYTNSLRNKIEMVGYSVIFPYSKKVIELTKNNNRIAYLRKPGLTEFSFLIDEKGIIGY